MMLGLNCSVCLVWWKVFWLVKMMMVIGWLKNCGVVFGGISSCLMLLVLVVEKGSCRFSEVRLCCG